MGGDTKGLESIDLNQFVMPPWPDELAEVVYVDHYENSNGLVEIALNQASAAAISGIRIGNSVRILK